MGSYCVVIMLFCRRFFGDTRGGVQLDHVLVIGSICAGLFVFQTSADIYFSAVFRPLGDMVARIGR